MKQYDYDKLQTVVSNALNDMVNTIRGEMHYGDILEFELKANGDGVFSCVFYKPTDEYMPIAISGRYNDR